MFTTRLAGLMALLLAAGTSTNAWSQQPAAGDAEAVKRFDTQIAPLLAGRCLACHSGQEKKGELDLARLESAMAGGESGKALVPGKLAESLLWEKVAGDEMPPKKPLTAAEKELLKKWIADGARWGTTPIDPFRYTSDLRAGYDWWALKPIVRAEPPKGESKWARSPIDRFVEVRLQERGLAPSPEAERGTLVRRLTFDLWGLPPTPEEVAAFESDNTPDAYERLVDRLLASPHYGERWGRHWLDVVRFGESQGFERDRIRPNAWRYRDWVIDALNRDMPYDEFLRLQLAGDVLQPDNPAAVIATGFLVAAPWDEVGQTQQSLPMRAVVRQDELEDLVGTIGQTCLGLTVNCARCHDHKFDPVSQVDYYRLTASLGGVRHGERESLAGAPQATVQEKRAQLDGQIAQLRKALEELTAGPRVQAVAKRQAKNPQPEVKVPQPIARWEFEDTKDSISGLEGTLHGKARLESGRLILDGSEGTYLATAPLAKGLSAKTLEVWLTVGDLKQRGGGAITVEALDGFQFDAMVYGERQEQKWIAGSNFFERTTDVDGPAEKDTKATIHLAIVYQPDKTIALYRNGKPYGKPYPAKNLIAYEPHKSRVVFGMRHSPAAPGKHFKGSIDRAAVYDRALSPEEIALSAGAPPDEIPLDEILALLPADGLRKHQELSFQTSQLELERGLLAAGLTYGVVPKNPEATFVLNRGNPGEPGEKVAPGAIVSVPANVRFELAQDAKDADRRLTLARWITDPANPLTARVMVNRLWHYHFGIGLVDTPNDFGFNGGRPSHPELLDWLAAELREQGWRLKPIHRAIVLSATYRQSSRNNDAALKIDRDNRLLWRRSPQRLEAESVRDAVLVAAGRLNPTMGGPGFKDFTTVVNNSQFYEMIDVAGSEFNRRSIYRTWIRSGTNKFLDVFDCPDPSTTTPKRAVTTTPLQALSLLNNAFMLRMSGELARRIESDVPEADAARRIERAYRLAFSRPAKPEEITQGTAFVQQHGLPAFCRVVFNSNEFLYVD